MIRAKTILTTVAVLGLCAAPTAAQEYQDLRSPDTVDAAREAQGAGTERGPYVLNRDYGSPDAVDAGRDLPDAMVSPSPRSHSGPIYTDAERKLVESPEVQGMIDRARSEIRATPSVVEVQAPSGFDWGDAGIGAAGMLALFCIGTGSALLIAGRRRRQGLSVATH
jgi:hypothetical protein